MKPSWLLFCFLLPLNAVLAYELPLPNKPHLVIEGHGEIKKIPDIVKINFEVSATAENLSLAKTSVDNTVSKAIKAAYKQGIKKDHINASKIQAHPEYDWTNNGRKYKGERISRQVEITLTDPSRYNTLVDALLATGINRLQNIEMDFSNRQMLEDKVMKLALKNAKQQAQSMAKALGHTLGGIFQIAPATRPVIMTSMEMKASGAMAKAQEPLTLGKQNIEQRVRVVYLLTN